MNRSTNTYSQNWSLSQDIRIEKRRYRNFLYEKENHLGNVLATISDQWRTACTPVTVGDSVVFTFNTYLATVTQATDYSAFGAPLPGRTFVLAGANKARHGFNGKEMDNEVSGEGNQYDYGFRIYNPRLGRFLSIDPLFQSFPWYTPYQFAGNKPIIAIDLDGLKEKTVTKKFSDLVTIDPALKPGDPPKAPPPPGNVKDDKLTPEQSQAKSEWENYNQKVSDYNWLLDIIKTYENAPTGSFEAEQREEIIKIGKPILLTIDNNLRSSEGAVTRVDKPMTDGTYSGFIIVFNKDIIDGYETNNRVTEQSQIATKKRQDNAAPGEYPDRVRPDKFSTAAHELGHVMYNSSHVKDLLKGSPTEAKAHGESEAKAQEEEAKYFKKTYGN